MIANTVFALIPELLLFNSSYIHRCMHTYIANMYHDHGAIHLSLQQASLSLETGRFLGYILGRRTPA